MALLVHDNENGSEQFGEDKRCTTYTIWNDTILVHNTIPHKFEVFAITFPDGKRVISIFEVYARHVTSFGHQFSGRMYVIHFEVLIGYQLVKFCKIQNYSKTTIWFLYRENGRNPLTCLEPCDLYDAQV